MSQLKSLNKNLDKLSEKLEDNADSWFNKPRGYLKKPDFKREQQTTEYIVSGRDAGIFSRMLGSSYSNRYFVLSIHERKLRYYESAEMMEEKGSIDLTYVDEVDYSHVRDAGNNSIDLITTEQHYTLQAETSEDMHKWALAIKRCLRKHAIDKHSSAVDAVQSAPSYSRESLVGRPDILTGIEKWHRFDFTYEEAGPMYMNVMGSSNRDAGGVELNSWVIVTEFELTPEGTPGRSEASGLISVKDYVVGVNGADLTTSTFNDAMDAIASATFPKTLHFLRDNEASKEQTRIESWATVYYTALNRRRRRYCEIKRNMLNFRKPAPGGSASGERDAFFLVDHISRVSPLIDMNAPEDQRYLLQLHCKDKSTVEHIGANDKSVGGSPVTVLEMCFPTEKNMNRWRSLFCSPTLFNSNEGVPADKLVTLSEGEEAELTSGCGGSTKSGAGAGAGIILQSSDALAIKSTLTNTISSRKFYILSDGHIWWERHAEKGKSGATSLRRSIFVADSQSCDLVKCFAKRTPLGNIGDTTYEYQLGLETKQSSLIICFAEEGDLTVWLCSLRELVAKAPKLTVPDSLAIPEEASEAADEAGGDDGDLEGDVYGSSSHEEGEMDTFQGYLYKRNDLLLPKGFSPQAAFAKVYVVLRANFFFLYHSQIESTSGVPPFATVPMGEMIEVREATDAGMPENAFEIVTMDKVYTFCSTDEDSLTLWMDAISDLLEARETTVHKVGSHVYDGNVGQDEYVKAIKASIFFSGGMTMKSVNLYTGIVSWRDRFVVITQFALSYYSDAKDVYNPETSAINDVSLGNIIDIRTCNHDNEPRCAPLCAFEVTAYVHKGGDEDGSRVFVFESRSAELCKQWMDSLAKATGKFEMETDETRVGFMKAVESRERMQQVATARAGAFAANSAGAGTALSRGNKAPGRGAGRGGVGRGGAGRGTAFSGRGKPKEKEPTEAEVEADIRAKAAASGGIPTAGASRLAPGTGPGSSTASGRIPAGARPPPGRGGGAGRGRGFAAPTRKASIAPKPGAI